MWARVIRWGRQSARSIQTKKKNRTGKEGRKEAEAEAKSHLPLPLRLLASRLLDNEVRILKEELQRTNLELELYKEKIKENQAKIKLNKQLPYLVGNIVEVGQPELIALEEALKDAMVPAGHAREHEYGREVPIFEVDATVVEPVFEHLYSYIFDIENDGYSAAEIEMDRLSPLAIFVVNFDKVRMDPRNDELDLDSLMYSKISELTEEEMKKQEGNYIYHYRYDGGGASQVWLGSGRFVVIDLSAGPCTYGKIETEEGSVSYRTLPRLWNLIFPRGSAAASVSSTHDISR